VVASSGEKEKHHERRTFKRKPFLKGNPMSPAAESLLQGALALPDGERSLLVEMLIASLQPEEGVPFDESWRAVIRRRSADLRSGRVRPVPWAEVKAQAREKAAG
jgi:putative addiction module component (TIGR02574 family)